MGRPTIRVPFPLRCFEVLDSTIANDQLYFVRHKRQVEKCFFASFLHLSLCLALALSLVCSLESTTLLFGPPWPNFVVGRVKINQKIQLIIDYFSSLPKRFSARIVFLRSGIENFDYFSNFRKCVKFWLFVFGFIEKKNSIAILKIFVTFRKIFRKFELSVKYWMVSGLWTMHCNIELRVPIIRIIAHYENRGARENPWGKKVSWWWSIVPESTRWSRTIVVDRSIKLS